MPAFGPWWMTVRGRPITPAAALSYSIIKNSGRILGRVPRMLPCSAVHCPAAVVVVFVLFPCPFPRDPWVLDQAAMGTVQNARDRMGESIGGPELLGLDPKPQRFRA